MFKPLPLIIASTMCVLTTGCASTGESQEFTHSYLLEPSESYASGEEKCEKELNTKAKEGVDADSFEVLKNKSAMKVDLKTGKSYVECTMVVLPPKN